MFAAILLLATIMAIFGVLGYLKGSKWAFISLMILSVAFILVENKPETVIATLNGLYMGVMLTLKGGLGALASGDLEAAKAALEDIEKPFTDQNQNLALLLVIFGAVLIGLILGGRDEKQAWRLRHDLGPGVRLHPERSRAAADQLQSGRHDPRAPAAPRGAATGSGGGAGFQCLRPALHEFRPTRDRRDFWASSLAPSSFFSCC